MPATNEYWRRQLVECMLEASRSLESFQKDSQPNIDDLDRALELHEGCCATYGFEDVNFENFTEIGKSLRAKQAHTNIEKDNHYE